MGDPIIVSLVPKMQSRIENLHTQTSVWPVTHTTITVFIIEDFKVPCSFLLALGSLKA